MRSALLLMLIASFILAVSSGPVRTAAKKYGGTVIFIDPENGVTEDPPIIRTEFLSTRYTTTINDAMNTNGITWEYRGVEPKGNPKCIYLKLIRNPHCTQKRPCFGWITTLTAGTKQRTYAGIFKGPPPDQGGTGEYIGVYPKSARKDSTSKKSQQLWESAKDMFDKITIKGVPKAGSVSEEPVRAKPFIIFIDIDNGEALASPKDTPWNQKNPMTRHINEMLDSSGSGTVEYRNTPEPASERDLYFIFIGGDPRCRDEKTPCYGWAGHGPYVHPKTGIVRQSQSDSFYMGIGKPGEPGEEWEHIYAYPNAKEGETLEAWAKLNTAFEEKIQQMFGVRALLGLGSDVGNK